jgi:integrase/transposase-like protein
MLEINWKQDYNADFRCPNCEKAQLRLYGFEQGVRRFKCPQCKSRIFACIKLISRSKYLASRLKDEHIDWETDYHGEFVCPECDVKGMSARAVTKNNKRSFGCLRCKFTTLSCVDLRSRSKYLDSRLKDEHIDWETDYHGEFVCPECSAEMYVLGIDNLDNKRLFRCSQCRKRLRESCHLDEMRRVEDPLNSGVEWYTNYRIKGFICPECQEENIYFTGIVSNKKRFQCRSCQKIHYDSIAITNGNISRYSKSYTSVKPFQWTDDHWDLRAINPNFDKRDETRHISSFTDFELQWFKNEVKQYIYYLCKTNSSLGTISIYLSVLRIFCRYLIGENITSFHEINRSLILDYLSKEKYVTKQKLGGLRNFFTVGTIKGWFKIDQDIIRNNDYPREYCSNPDPISDMVRKQIEENLHLLPDPIARMWIVCYFAAMRPSEISLLKYDCLVQEGQYWKLVWNRKKGKDEHEVPISITIAQVVQEQQEYIKNLWGDEWDYLFCHYQNLSSTDPSMPKLEPVKKVLSGSTNDRLSAGIRTLIKTCDIRDENGQLAKFTTKLLRSTRLTELFEQGHDLAVVSAWAGHKNLYTTSTYYTQVSCELMEREAGHIQKALVNSSGHRVLYESFPKSFWENPTAHKLELGDTHINTPIYGYCGLPLDQDCHKFRACYTCQSFVATVEKLPQYLNVLSELRAKQAKAMSAGQEVLVEQFGRQAEQLDKIIASLQQEAA